MSEVCAFVCGISVMCLIVLCAIVSMMFAFISDDPPKRDCPGPYQKHRNNGRSVEDGCISQKSVPGGV